MDKKYVYDISTLFCVPHSSFEPNDQFLKTSCENYAWSPSQWGTI